LEAVLLHFKLALSMILIAASSASAGPAVQEADEWELVAKLCGKLELVEHVADKKNPIIHAEKRSPITEAKLLAYERRDNSSCCRNAEVAAETTPNKSGSFEFKNLPYGNYWFVAVVNQQQYVIPVLVKRTQEKLAVCSQLSFAIDDSGKFSMRVRAPGR